MKRVYVNEEWCLGCHLCEYYCAFANSGLADMVKALKGKKIRPNIRVEGDAGISFAVSCRHCSDALCVSGCLTGAMSVKDGVISIDKERCIGCLTCVALCPYGAVMPSDDGVVQKCELCTNHGGEPVCVKNCPNHAIVYVEEAER